MTKDLINFKSTDIKIGQKIEEKVLDARVNVKFKGRGRVSFEEYEAGIRDLPSDLRKEVNKAVDIVIQRITEALDVAISTAIWKWRDGARDIVDTGALRDSLKIQKAGNGFTISYSQPYAAIVHYGGYIQYPYGNPNAEKFYYPARPWIDSVLNGTGPGPSIDFEAIFEEAFEKVSAKYRQ
jgi:phage gpG-like protein